MRVNSFAQEHNTTEFGPFDPEATALNTSQRRLSILLIHLFYCRFSVPNTSKCRLLYSGWIDSSLLRDVPVIPGKFEFLEWKGKIKEINANWTKKALCGGKIMGGTKMPLKTMPGTKCCKRLKYAKRTNLVVSVLNCL